MALTPQRKVTNVRPVPSGRANASHFGGLEAQALQGLGQDVQSAAGDLASIQNRQDSYVAKNAYLDARKESISFVDQQLALEGENAFNASFDTQMKMVDIEQRLTEGMSDRQRHIFMQNWKPASIQDQERVAVHQGRQVKFAEEQTNQALIDSSAAEFVHHGEELSLQAMKASLTSISKSQGWSPEQFDQKWKVAHDHAVTARISALTNAEDFTGAEKLIDQYGEELGGTQTQHMQLELDRAKVRRENRIASAANQKQREAQIDEQVFILDTDPTAVPPMEKYAEWYGPEIGRIKHAERLVAVQKADEARVTTDMQIDRMNALTGASTLVEQIYAGQADLDDVYATANTLAADGSEASKIALSQLKGALTDTRDSKPKSVDVESSRIFADSVRAFNEINAGGGRSGIRKLYGGKVGTTPTGSINTSDEATSAFQQYWAGWEEYKADAMAVEGTTMTLKRLRELEDEYFAPMRQARSRESFRRAAENYPVFKATSGTGFFYDDVQNRVDEAGAALLNEIMNPEAANEPKG